MSGEQYAMNSVDLSQYASGIFDAQDNALFYEAVETGKVGALRASYIMIWLACAESLKRRFREAQVRDSTAGRIVGEVDNLEQQQRAVDKFLLGRSHDYGFLSDSALTVLTHIYEMRCIYGHYPTKRPLQRKRLWMQQRLWSN